MVMVELTLKNELITAWSTGYDNEVDAINALAAAYKTYAGDAASNGSTILPAFTALGETAMKAALVGMSADGAAAAKVAAGVVAFWGAAAVPTAFGANVAAVPPPHATLAADLAAIWNGSTWNDVDTPAGLVAAKMHLGATTGGTASFPPPPAGTPYPIL